MKRLLLLVMVSTGCGEIIEPGHRGLYFARHGGLQHDVLPPGWHGRGPRDRIDDFDVTYQTRKEEIRTVSSEGLNMELKVALIYETQSRAGRLSPPVPILSQ